MKKILSIFVIFITTAFSQEAPQQFKEMFYITMGSEIPLQKSPFYSKYDRSLESIGIGVREFFLPAHGIDVCASMYIHPNLRMAELTIGYICKPQILYGIYLKASGHTRNTLTSCFNKFNELGYRGSLGYQIPSQERKSAFLEVSVDDLKNLSVRSGLLF